MKILVVGNGGREHALCNSIKKSSLCEDLFCIPGSDAIDALAKCYDIDINNNHQILDFCIKKKISFVVIGPEIPLTNGLVDLLEYHNIKSFGPNKKGAMLEKSKIYTKELCVKYNVPTGKYRKFNQYEEACLYCDTLSFPIVIKADGLAAGKGVIIAKNLEEAREAVKKCMKEKIFADAGKEIIIEEFLEGEEISLFSLVDSTGYVLPLTTAQDHKKIEEGEKGLNTGGMGAYSPIPFIKDKKIKNLNDQFVRPIIKALNESDIKFKGMFYAGIILTKNGPKLLEINVRFGDPETQAILPRIKSDLLKILYASSTGSLNTLSTIEWDPKYCMAVVMATKGYPKKHPKNTLIENIDSIDLLSNDYIFHSGTKKKNGLWFSNGGRVLSISSLGETIKLARNNIHSIIEKIKWKEGYFRKDIGWRYIK